MFFRVAQKCDTRCDTRSHFSPKLVKAKMITFYNWSTRKSRIGLGFHLDPLSEEKTSEEKLSQSR